MRKPFFERGSGRSKSRDERGVTMLLVAFTMVAIIAMAALSIDVVTLYVSREEAQRAADAGALAAARVISLSGITGTTTLDTDPGDWTQICGGASSLATQVALAAAQQNGISNNAGSVTVKYSYQSGGLNADCSTLSDNFAINPQVTVQVTRGSLPTLFSRIWSHAANTVSATATAEVLNPSNSASIAPGGDTIPVTPHCVKPMIIPNQDPAGGPFVNTSTGAIAPAEQNIVTGGVGQGIGEPITLNIACSGSDCTNMEGNTPGAGSYIPALVTQAAAAVGPSCSGSTYQNAVAGCDVSTVYACGTPSGAQADLTINPHNDVFSGMQCVTNMPNNDLLDVSSYPFKITAGPGNPIAPASQVITASNSVMTVPIYDGAPLPGGNSQPQVTIVGYMQIFVTNVNGAGTINAYVLNIAGCGNDASTTLSAPGTSPVPIRLITPN